MVSRKLKGVPLKITTFLDHHFSSYDPHVYTPPLASSYALSLGISQLVEDTGGGKREIFDFSTLSYIGAVNRKSTLLSMMRFPYVASLRLYHPVGIATIPIGINTIPVGTLNIPTGSSRA